MERLGQYELVKRLAVGGMAELYLATSPGLKGFKHSLVLKKLLPELASDRAFVEMFLGEARIAGELNHPNIAHVYEVGEANGAYFIAMEYVDGPNLRAVSNGARRAGKPISPYLAAKIVSCVCDGLGYAHDLRDPESGEPLRIVHRDISPENIIIARNGSVKVVDFGIAKASFQLHRTQTGIVKGKLQYMAPEQMSQNRQIDCRADIYSLGVVLYELLAGARPYVAKDDVALAEAVLLRDPPPVPLVRRCPLLPSRCWPSWTGRWRGRRTSGTRAAARSSPTWTSSSTARSGSPGRRTSPSWWRTSRRIPPGRTPRSPRRRRRRRRTARSPWSGR